MLLGPLLSESLFPFVLVFLRMGAAMMLLPGVGEAAVSSRIRLMFALAFTVIITPVVADRLPALPPAPLMVGLLIVGETVIGLFFGVITRLIMAALHTAGMILAFQSSLAAAMMFDPAQGARSSLSGNFLNLIALMMLFATNMHHLLLRGLVDTYVLFPPGQMLPVGDSADAVARVSADAIRIGFQIATPAIATGFLLYLGGGILNRLMPRMMVFFVLLPIQITIGFAILGITLGAAMLWFMNFFDETMVNFAVL